MRLSLIILLSSVLYVASPHATAQTATTFKAGWKTYDAATLIQDYTYSYVPTDSLELVVKDSALTYITADSSVVMTEYYKKKENAFYKDVSYFTTKKQLARTELYKDDYLIESNEWKYDDKNRKLLHLRTNNLNKNTYKKTYDYSTDKKTGETVVMECAYFNGKIEFYTQQYFDKHDVLNKEVRLNDNKKDVVHVETYTYGENGKVKERSVYFPQFKVTKKFAEPAGAVPAKCYCIKPAGIAIRATLANRNDYVKKVLIRNKVQLSDTTCPDFEYTFTNSLNCSITVANAGKARSVRYRFRQKI